MLSLSRDQSLFLGLGRKEGIENAIDDFSWNPLAVIGHGQQQVRPRFQSIALSGPRRFDHKVRDLDGQFPTVGHRIAGVQCEIHHNL